MPMLHLALRTSSSLRYRICKHSPQDQYVIKPLSKKRIFKKGLGIARGPGSDVLAVTATAWPSSSEWTVEIKLVPVPRSILQGGSTTGSPKNITYSTIVPVYRVSLAENNETTFMKNRKKKKKIFCKNMRAE